MTRFLLAFIVGSLLTQVYLNYKHFEKLQDDHSILLHCILEGDVCQTYLLPHDYYGHPFQNQHESQPNPRKVGKHWNRVGSYGF